MIDGGDVLRSESTLASGANLEAPPSVAYDSVPHIEGRNSKQTRRQSSSYNNRTSRSRHSNGAFQNHHGTHMSGASNYTSPSLQPVTNANIYRDSRFLDSKGSVGAAWSYRSKSESPTASRRPLHSNSDSSDTATWQESYALESQAPQLDSRRTTIQPFTPYMSSEFSLPSADIGEDSQHTRISTIANANISLSSKLAHLQKLLLEEKHIASRNNTSSRTKHDAYSFEVSHRSKQKSTGLQVQKYEC